MTNLQHLLQTKQWAEDWLAKPAHELPGNLTHEKCLEVLESVEDQLIDHLAIQVSNKGVHLIYAEAA